MKPVCLAMFLLTAAPLLAQPETLSLDDIIDSADQWARENLTEDTIRALQSIDRAKTEDFFTALQRDFQGEYVVDLAQLRDAARVVLPLLESHQETLPYAAWLRTRMDYLEVADQLRILVPPPKIEPDKSVVVRSNPPAQKQREVWTRQIASRPWPAQAQPYVSLLKPIFAREKIPAELVWIAEVESSFERRARSPAGAAGLFQLMPATARRYGLSLFPLDERLAPEASARAAARHLAYLGGRFRDWRLALAAYNAGEGTVDRLLKSRARTFDAIASALPAETQMYVPKVEATLLRREGKDFSALPLPPPPGPIKKQ